jgi:hypothetical protein
MENPLINDIAKKQHEAKTWTWSGQTTEGQASDCHNLAKIMPDEDYFWTTYHPCFMKLRNLVPILLSESIFMNFDVDDVI